MTKEEIIYLLQAVTAKCLNAEFRLRVESDVKNPDGRLFLQWAYDCVDSHNKNATKPEEWRGRKWYLSEHMTEDEIVKTAYLAFEIAVRHEVLEGFRFNDALVFNPHTPYTSLLKASKISENRITSPQVIHKNTYLNLTSLRGVDIPTLLYKIINGDFENVTHIVAVKESKFTKPKFKRIPTDIQAFEYSDDISQKITIEMYSDGTAKFKCLVGLGYRANILIVQMTRAKAEVIMRTYGGLNFKDVNKI